MKEELVLFLNMLELEGMRKNSVEAYGRDIRQMTEWLQARGCIACSTITQDAIMLYLEHLQASDKSSATIARQVASMRRFVKYLGDRGYKFDEKHIALTKHKLSRKPFLILQKDDIQRLLSAPDLSSASGLRDYLMLKMLYETGIRVSELITLKISDIDFKRRRIMCKTPYEQRMVYLNQDLVKKLKKYLALREIDFGVPDTPVFVNCYGQGISRQGLWKIVKIYADQQKLDCSVTPHTLRHSFAVHLLQDGGTIKHLQMIMGHQDVASTQVYESYISSDVVTSQTQDTV